MPRLVQIIAMLPGRQSFLINCFKMTLRNKIEKKNENALIFVVPVKQKILPDQNPHIQFFETRRLRRYTIVYEKVLKIT